MYEIRISKTKFEKTGTIALPCKQSNCSNNFKASDEPMAGRVRADVQLPDMKKMNNKKRHKITASFVNLDHVLFTD